MLQVAHLTCYTWKPDAFILIELFAFRARAGEPALISTDDPDTHVCVCSVHSGHNGTDGKTDARGNDCEGEIRYISIVNFTTDDDQWEFAALLKHNFIQQQCAVCHKGISISTRHFGHSSPTLCL